MTNDNVTDIVERLRSKYCCDASDCNCDEAADAIATLRKQLENARKAAMALYLSGRWSCDSNVDEAKLWADLRDANEIPVGTETARSVRSYLKGEK